MSDLPIPLTDAVTVVDDGAYESSWHKTLVDSDTFVVEIDVEACADQDGFMTRASDGLQLTGDGRVRKWSGLQDRLWEALLPGEHEVAVFVLRHVDTLVERNLRVFLTALEVFADVKRQVGTERQSFPRQIDVYVIVTGTGPSFPSP
jgi:hypothetical protein